MPSPLRVAVVGAGAFGGWTALRLVRRGARVTLLDAWGPGNARASSGGETRILRGVYGPDRVYVDWVARSLAVWKESERLWGTRLYHPAGVLWMCGTDDAYVRASLPLLRDAGLAAAEIDPDEARRRWPQIDFEGIRHVFFEESAGYLMARRACRAVAAAVTAEGGEVVEAAVRPGEIRGGRMERIELSGGSSPAFDAVVFACGPWLGRLFPDVIGERVLPTRQEVFFFGPPAGDARFRDRAAGGGGGMPVWAELGERFFYGIPGNDHRGFKVADDTRGEPFDPTSGDRTPTPAAIERARSYLARRFPALAGAPLLETRVCQYENSPDGHLLLDRHPEAANVWIAGGGSGHGFKLGPAVGEHVAALVLGEAEPRPGFALGRPGAARAAGAPLKTQLTSEGSG
jgi:glycine/D-amino acid oxidase-like deaminating enzyme